MKQTLIAERTPAQSVEDLVLSYNYRERDAALNRVKANLQTILRPRSVVHYGSSSAYHFLPVPDEPDPKDLKATARWRAELDAITIQERELTTAAQRIKQMVEPLTEWASALGTVEEHLQISQLTAEDEPDAEAYAREHRRYIRTCSNLAAELEI